MTKRTSTSSSGNRVAAGPECLRRTQRLTDDGGLFRMWAMGHVADFKVRIHASASDEEMVKRKSDILSGIGSLVSAVIVDPEFSLASLIEGRIVGRGTGLMAALEAGFTTDAEGGRPWMRQATQALPIFSLAPVNWRGLKGLGGAQDEKWLAGAGA